MRKFRHHAYFAKPKQLQTFRFPFVCFVCRKSFKYPANLAERRCPQCRGGMVMLSRKFSAPKAKDRDQWKKIQLLVEHGFRFYPVYKPVAGGWQAVRYPQLLNEVAEFVRDFAAQVPKQFAPHTLLTDARQDPSTSQS